MSTVSPELDQGQEKVKNPECEVRASMLLAAICQVVSPFAA